MTYPQTANQEYAHLFKKIKEQPSQTARGTTFREMEGTLVTLCNHNSLVTASGRSMNVAFAAAEIFWILRGSRKVSELVPYSGKIAQFSDDGTVFNAAYGQRMRKAYGYDQLEDCIDTLRSDPGSRQASIILWHPNDRRQTVTKDRACNVYAHMMIRDGQLNWMQVVRSNDIVLGTPYNWMQWTWVQRYAAAKLGVKPGTLKYAVDSWHAYEDTFYNCDDMNIEIFDLYKLLGFREENELNVAHMDAAMDIAERLHEQHWANLDQLVDNALRNVAMPSGIAALNDDRVGPLLWLMIAHLLYKKGHDISAYGALCVVAKNHPVYALAQYKFYWQNRWSKLDHVPPADGELMRIAYISYGRYDQILNWIKE